jgi:hypothetical protein
MSYYEKYIKYKCKNSKIIYEINDIIFNMKKSSEKSNIIKNIINNIINNAISNIINVYSLKNKI